MEQPRRTTRNSVSGRPSYKPNVSDSKATIEKSLRSNSYETLPDPKNATEENEDSDLLSEESDDVDVEEDNVERPQNNTSKHLHNKRETDDMSGMIPEGNFSEYRQQKSRVSSASAKGPKLLEVSNIASNVARGPISWLIIVVVILVGCVIAKNSLNSNSVLDDQCKRIMMRVKRETSLINKDIIISLQAGINQTLTRNSPSVFLYLYKDASESDMDKLVSNLAAYTSCGLNKENLQPIELTSRDLDSEEAREDYGYILARYKDDLKRRKVMVVKHLESVPVAVAQAFHSLCDEVSPLVERSIFIFTMRVDHFSKPEYRVVEETLLEKWKNLKYDILSPLLTRITGMILNIKM